MNGSHYVNILILFCECSAPPSPPQSLCVAKETSSTVTLVWEEPEYDGGAPVSAFSIDIKGLDDAEFRNLCRLDGDLFTYTATNLNSGTEYYFQVRAENEAGTSEDAAELKQPASTKAKASENCFMFVFLYQRYTGC